MARVTVPQMAQAILDASAALFVGPLAFDRACLSPGAPSGAGSCSQITVHYAQIVNASPGTRSDPGPQRTHARPTPTFVVTMMRCVHGLDDRGHAPSEANVQLDGERHLGDIDILWYGLTEAIAAKTLIEGLGCSSFRLAIGQALRPDGMGGSIVNIEVTP